MPDAIQMVKDDHRKVERLFQEFEQSQSTDVALQICTELRVHTTLEEELLYPILRHVDTGLADEAQQEHDEAKSLVEQVEAASADDGTVTSLMEQLKAAVEHHVSEEEEQVLPRLEEEAGDQMGPDMVEAITQRKQELLREMGETTVDLSKEELYEKAKEADIPGRSKMDKEELAQALEER
jgi:hemerythrin superfamily protein